MNRTTVSEFARRCLRPERTTVVLTGDLSPDQALKEMERTLGTWPAAGHAAEPLPPPAPHGRRRVCLIDRPGAPQSELRLVNLAIPRSSPDQVTAEVMNSLFGGKFTSRLNLNLREKHGYTYGARSWIAARRAGGVFGISTAVETGVTVPALEQALLEVDRLLSGPVEPAELDDTRSFLAGLFPLTIETSGDVLSRLLEIELYGLPDDHFDRYPERVRAVSAEDVLRVARANVRPAEMVVLVVGDAARLEGPLSALGAVERLDETGEPVA